MKTEGSQCPSFRESTPSTSSATATTTPKTAKRCPSTGPGRGGNSTRPRGSSPAATARATTWAARGSPTKPYYWAYSIRLPEGTADTYRIFPASDYEPSACIRTGDEISFTYYKDQKGDLVIDEYHCPRAEQRLQAWIDAQSDETLQKAGLK